MKIINYGKWANEEIKELFLLVEDYKNKGKAISKAFSLYALKYNRHANSVRNYYYAELAALYKDSARVKSLGINLAAHSKQVFVEFDKKETCDLIKKIICNLARGKSVRATCLELSSGNIDSMIRYQNKYRSALKSNTELIREIMNELDLRKIDYVNPLQSKKTIDNAGYSNILKMPKLNSKITDSDLNDLFFGVVKLIKKTAEDEVSAKLKSECEFANSTLRSTIIELNEKEKELNLSMATIKDLTQKLNEASDKLRKYQTGSYTLKAELDRLKNQRKTDVQILNNSK